MINSKWNILKFKILCTMSSYGQLQFRGIYPFWYTYFHLFIDMGDAQNDIDMCNERITS